jgi:preprotein translocase subunit SecE
MMTDPNDKNTTTEDDPTTSEADVREEAALVEAEAEVEAEIVEAESAVPTQLGAQRYVLAGFFAAGMAVAYLISKVLAGIWNRLADNVWVSAHAPALTRIAEDERPSYTMLVGAVAGIFSAFYAYRRPDIRQWTNEVAAELAKVTWPSKKEVTNSTVVVLLTSTFATVFLALLDRFWGFVTNLVYGS